MTIKVHHHPLLLTFSGQHEQTGSAMRTITTTTVVISASADRVWKVLSDLPRWSEWNPFIIKAGGCSKDDSDLARRGSPSTNGFPGSFCRYSKQIRDVRSPTAND